MIKLKKKSQISLIIKSKNSLKKFKFCPKNRRTVKVQILNLKSNKLNK